MNYYTTNRINLGLSVVKGGDDLKENVSDDDLVLRELNC